jgi:hypothetical protein
LRDAQAATATMTGVASSPDGNVVVTVDATQGDSLCAWTI